MACCGMEVDPPQTTSATSTLGMNPLKRSNSAPMINVIVTSSTSVATSVVSTTTSMSFSSNACNTTAISINTNPGPSIQHPSLSPTGSLCDARVRRFSTSSMALHSPTTPVKTRLIQIKQEESIPQGLREAAHEREIQLTHQISRSWDHLIVDESHGPGQSIDPARRPKSLGEPLHIQTTLYGHSSSPSPTRGLGKQCFSPSLHVPIHSSVLSPTPSPSPTRKTFRRSASPITLRPSPLGVKRKMEMDWADRPENYFSPPKRFFMCAQSPGHTSDKSGLGVGPLNHPLITSTSCGSVGSDSSGGEQRVPSVYSTPLAIGTAVSSLPSATSTPSPCYMFRAVRDSVESSHGTDSETSDMTETTDISEHTENSVNMNDSSMLDVNEAACSSHSAGSIQVDNDSSNGMATQASDFKTVGSKDSAMEVQKSGCTASVTGSPFGTVVKDSLRNTNLGLVAGAGLSRGSNIRSFQSIQPGQNNM